MIVQRPFPESDLAPGDVRSKTFSRADFQIREVSQPDDPDFDSFYNALDVEFGHRGEMETREVLQQRLRWSSSEVSSGHHLRYRMLGLCKEQQLAAVRDHTVILKTKPTASACVHLSHVLVSPEWRRSGIAGWMRAFPVQDARQFCLELGLSRKTPIALVAEMEPFDSPEQLPRLKAYSRAGFRRVDPSLVHYRQPDFRPFSAIDASGGARPLPFWLMVRPVGREDMDVICGAELRSLVGSLYAMYSQAFRLKDMASLYADLESYPDQNSLVALEDISSLL